jgi:predicted nucleic acid-binding protein
VAVVPILQQLRQLSGHQFWNDDISLMDARYVDSGRLLQSGQITDSYLLALAVHHGGKLATLDGRLCVDAVLQWKSSIMFNLNDLIIACVG